MIKPQLNHKDAAVRYRSYIAGFGLSVLTTLVAYFLVVSNLWPRDMLIIAIMGLAVVQLVVQLIFFLHLGKGSKWKLVTFVFALIIVLIVVIGSLWIMYNLDYNMMHMTPDQMQEYMYKNQGI